MEKGTRTILSWESHKGHPRHGYPTENFSQGYRDIMSATGVSGDKRLPYLEMRMASVEWKVAEAANKIKHFNHQKQYCLT